MRGFGYPCQMASETTDPPQLTSQERLDRLKEEFRVAKQRQLLKQETANLNRAAAQPSLLPDPPFEKLN